MILVYDAGVLVAAERNDRNVWADRRARLESGIAPVTTAPVVAQVSRSARQTQLRRFLRGCDVVAFTGDQAHGVGALLRAAGTADVIDAHLIFHYRIDGWNGTHLRRGDLSMIAAHAPTVVRIDPV